MRGHGFPGSPWHNLVLGSWLSLLVCVVVVIVAADTSPSSSDSESSWETLVDVDVPSGNEQIQIEWKLPPLVNASHETQIRIDFVGKVSANVRLVDGVDTTLATAHTSAGIAQDHVVAHAFVPGGASVVRATLTADDKASVLVRAAFANTPAVAIDLGETTTFEKSVAELPGFPSWYILTLPPCGAPCVTRVELELDTAGVGAVDAALYHESFDTLQGATRALGLNLESEMRVRAGSAKQTTLFAGNGVAGSPSVAAIAASVSLQSAGCAPWINSMVGSKACDEVVYANFTAPRLRVSTAEEQAEKLVVGANGSVSVDGILSGARWKFWRAELPPLKRLAHEQRFNSSVLRIAVNTAVAPRGSSLFPPYGSVDVRAGDAAPESATFLMDDAQLARIPQPPGTPKSRMRCGPCVLWFEHANTNNLSDVAISMYASSGDAAFSMDVAVVERSEAVKEAVGSNDAEQTCAQQQNNAANASSACSACIASSKCGWCVNGNERRCVPGTGLGARSALCDDFIHADMTSSAEQCTMPPASTKTFACASVRTCSACATQSHCRWCHHGGPAAERYGVCEEAIDDTCAVIQGWTAVPDEGRCAFPSFSPPPPPPPPPTPPPSPPSHPPSTPPSFPPPPHQPPPPPFPAAAGSKGTSVLGVVIPPWGWAVGSVAAGGMLGLIVLAILLTIRRMRKMMKRKRYLREIDERHAKSNADATEALGTAEEGGKSDQHDGFVGIPQAEEVFERAESQRFHEIERSGPMMGWGDGEQRHSAPTSSSAEAKSFSSMLRAMLVRVGLVSLSAKSEQPPSSRELKAAGKAKHLAKRGAKEGQMPQAPTLETPMPAAAGGAPPPSFPDARHRPAPGIGLAEEAEGGAGETDTENEAAMADVGSFSDGTSLSESMGAGSLSAALAAAGAGAYGAFSGPHMGTTHLALKVMPKHSRNDSTGSASIASDDFTPTNDGSGGVSMSGNDSVFGGAGGISASGGYRGGGTGAGIGPAGQRPGSGPGPGVTERMQVLAAADNRKRTQGVDDVLVLEGRKGGHSSPTKLAPTTKDPPAAPIAGGLKGDGALERVEAARAIEALEAAAAAATANRGTTLPPLAPKRPTAFLAAPPAAPSTFTTPSTQHSIPDPESTVHPIRQIPAPVEDSMATSPTDSSESAASARAAAARERAAAARRAAEQARQEQERRKELRREEKRKMKMKAIDSSQ